MKPVRFFLLLLAAICCTPLVSCVSISYPQPSGSELELGRTLVPPKDQGLVVVYRKPSASITTRKIPTAVWVDGKPHGANHAGTFVVVPVSKGRHVVRMFRDPSSARANSGHELHVAVGKCSFNGQSVETKVDKVIFVPTPAPVPRIEVDSTPVSEETGRAEVSKCKQLGGNGMIKRRG